MASQSGLTRTAALCHPGSIWHAFSQGSATRLCSGMLAAVCASLTASCASQAERDVARDDVAALAVASTLPRAGRVARPLIIRKLSAAVPDMSARAPLATDCRGSVAAVTDDSTLSIFHVAPRRIDLARRMVLPAGRSGQLLHVVRLAMRGDSLFAFDAASQRVFVVARGAVQASETFYPSAGPGRPISDLTWGGGDTLYARVEPALVAGHAPSRAAREIVLALTPAGAVLDDSLVVARARRWLTANAASGPVIRVDPFDRRLLVASSPHGALYYAWSEFPAVAVISGLRRPPGFVRADLGPAQPVRATDLDSLATSTWAADKDVARYRAQIAASAPKTWPPVSALFVGSNGSVWAGRARPDWQRGLYSVAAPSDPSTARFTVPPETYLLAACGDTAFGVTTSSGRRRLAVLTPANH